MLRRGYRLPLQGTFKYGTIFSSLTIEEGSEGGQSPVDLCALPMVQFRGLKRIEINWGGFVDYTQRGKWPHVVSVSRTAAPLVKHCCIPEINSYSQISSSSPLHRNVPLLKLQHFPDEWETSSINSCLALLLNRKWYKKMFVQYQIILHSHIIAPHYWQAQKKEEISNISGWVGELNLAWFPNTSGLSQVFQVWGLIKTSE